MDFFERIFGIIPDSGTGALELATVLVLLVGPVLVLMIRKGRIKLF